MRRLLACLWYHFASQRILLWVGGFGLVLIALGLILRGSPLILLGSVFLAFFPILVGGLSYRQLIANRRIAMVPDIRYFAAGALFLLAVGGATLAYVVATAAEPNQDAGRVGLLAFSSISLYLVLSQWLVTRRLEFFFIAILPLFLLRFVVPDDALAWEELLAPWHWLAIAGLGWLWLAIAVRDRGLPRSGSLAVVIGVESAGAAVTTTDRSALLRSSDRIATAPGTLMRGVGDALPNRVLSALMAVLMMPVVMGVVFALLELPPRETEAPRFPGEFLLTMSFFGICTFPAMLFGEWPVRLRLIWLRVRGDRAALWRRLERSLLQEQLLIVAVAALVAIGLLLWSEVPREIVYFYVASSLFAALVGGYLGFWVRISGWSAVVQGLLLPVIGLAFLVGGLWIRNSGDPQDFYWLFPALGFLALAFRTLARFRFRRMDWCKVRPQRFPRRAI